MPKVIKEDIANQIANEVLALIKSKDATFKSNQIGCLNIRCNCNR